MLKSILFGGAVLAVANAQAGAWEKCGGDQWTGPTTCISGYYCKFSNQWYSQCLPGSPNPTTAASTTAVTTTASRTTTSSSKSVTTPVTTPVTTTRITTTLSTTTSTTLSTTTKTTTSQAPAGTGLTWLGVNESGAEFGQASYPGVWGTHFIFPANSAIDTLVAQGYNMFRVPFAMERLAPSGVASSFSAAYLANLTASVNYMTSKGAYAILDPHNFGRYNGAIITDVAAFGTFWTNLANAFKTNSKVVFDTNNEYHDMDQTLVFNLNQVAINSIRATGATSQYIFVEGNSWSGAWVWTQYNDNLKALTDPSNKIIYEMHQYLDSDGSGTSENCVSSTIGAERVASATAWLKANGKQGIIGEFAGGANTQCMAAVKGLLDHVKANSDVWKGALWWGGGPWWGTYIFGFEPPAGTGYSYYNQALLAYKP